MKLDDPFGRVTRKNQHAYAMLRDRLLDEGVTDRAALDRFRHNMRATAGRLVLLALSVCTVLAVLFPQAAGALILFGLIIVAWLGAGYWQTRAHVHRFRRELAGTETQSTLQSPDSELSKPHDQ